MGLGLLARGMRVWISERLESSAQKSLSFTEGGKSRWVRMCEIGTGLFKINSFVSFSSLITLVGRECDKVGNDVGPCQNRHNSSS